MINAATQNHYQGNNAQLCMRAMDAFNFSSEKFATFKQWRDLGRTVIKGQKGVTLKKMVKKTTYNTQGQPVQKLVPVPFTVFNIDQTQPLH